MTATIEIYRPAVHSMQWLGSANIIHTSIRFVATVCHELYTTKVKNKETVSQSTAQALQADFDVPTYSTMLPFSRGEIIWDKAGTIL